MTYSDLVIFSPLILLSAVSLSIITNLLFGSRTINLNLFLFSYWPLLSVSFFAFSIFKPSGRFIDIVAGLVFDLIILAMVVYFFGRLWRLTAPGLGNKSIKLLKKFQGVIILTVLSIMVLKSFSFTSIYFNYFGHMLNFTGCIVCAGLINNKLRMLPLLFILSLFLWMLILGSKGSAFISILQIFSLCRKRLTPKLLYGSVAFILSLLTLIYFRTLNGTRDFLEYTLFVIKRFSLHNDTRSMALFTNNNDRSLLTFLSESFRGIGALFGLEYTHDPLGQVLYLQEFGTEGVGGNASLVALAFFYFYPNQAFAVIFPIVILWFLLILVLTNIRFKTQLTKIVILSLVSFLTLLLSQDFLAFLTVLVLSTIIFLVAIALVPKGFNVSRGKPRNLEHREVT